MIKKVAVASLSYKYVWESIICAGIICDIHVHVNIIIVICRLTGMMNNYSYVGCKSV